MKPGIKKFIAGAVFFVAAAAGLSPTPLFAAAKAPFIYAAWLPYWNKQPGAQDFALVLNKFREISPFSYEVRADGTLRDDSRLNSGFWPAWLSAVRDGGVKIIPTVAWLYGDEIGRLLSKKALRIRHENAIAVLVRENNFDGIDIDYEDKNAETRDYFSTFLYGLAIRLHPMKKTLVCTIEARTPADSRYSTPRATPPQYANNYRAINKYCDEVRVMAYDQGTIDLKLDAAKGSSTLYAPVADPDWAEKVIKETIKTINPRKIMLGIPTYGYEYEVSWNASTSETTYDRLRSWTFDEALLREAEVHAIPFRNNAGEIGYAYTTSTSYAASPGILYAIASTAAPVLPALPADSGSKGGVLRYVTMSDAYAMNQKILLAKKYGLKGAVFFKMDGEVDPALWQYLK